MHLGLLAGVLLGPVACGDGTDLVAGQAMVAASGTGGSGGAAALPAHCAGAAAPPATLECTGLYADLATGKLAPGVREYAPAYALWSDGADKRRWIGLPAGSVIDASDPNEWVFPVGTRVWKEFAQQGIRVETRLWQKVSANFWVNAVYVWNQDQSAAPRSKGGDIPFGDGTYHVPTQEECEKCHRGRTEHILGFSAVDLGLPGATRGDAGNAGGRGPAAAAAGEHAAAHRRRRHWRGRARAWLAARQLRQHLPQRQLAGHRLHRRHEPAARPAGARRPSHDRLGVPDDDGRRGRSQRELGRPGAHHPRQSRSRACSTT